MSAVSGTSDSERRLQWALAAVALAVSAAFLGAYLYVLFGAGFKTNDFFVFWAAAKHSQQTSLAATYDAGTFTAFELGLAGTDYHPLPFLYPPHAALLFAPFAALPFQPALLLWNALGLAVYLAAVRQALRAGGWPLLAALVAPATAVNLIFGQTGLLTSGLLLSGFGLLQRRPLLAGLLFGLLSIKPQFAVVPALILLLCGQYRAAAAAAGCCALLLLASCAAFGAGAWPAWLAAMHDFSGSLAASAAHQQYGVTVYFTLLDLGLDRYWAVAGQGLALGLTLWAVVRVLRRGHGMAATLAALVGVFLATPYAVIYDLPVISAVCLALAAEGRRSGFRDGELLAIASAWCLPLLMVLLHRASAALSLAMLAGLFVLILRRAASTPDAAA